MKTIQEEEVLLYIIYLLFVKEKRYINNLDKNIPIGIFCGKDLLMVKLK